MLNNTGKRSHIYPGAMVKSGKVLGFNSYCPPLKRVQEYLNANNKNNG